MAAIPSRSCPLWVKSGHRHVGLMSALPPKADIGGRQLDVRFVPATDFRRRPPHVRLAPKSKLNPGIARCLRRAKQTL
jgi:hypothetical protein